VAGAVLPDGRHPGRFRRSQREGHGRPGRDRAVADGGWAEAFNLDKHVNLGNWIGDLASAADFGHSVEAYPARQVQLSLRVSF
jgi:hypothetical protein